MTRLEALFMGIFLVFILILAVATGHTAASGFVSWFLGLLAFFLVKVSQKMDQRDS